MLEKRNILYFKPFYFENGTAKPKFFVVLEDADNKHILASLPTSRDNVPESSQIKTGCVELPDISFNCFVLPANSPVCENGKSFEVKTHIYGHQISLHDKESLIQKHPIEGIQYEVWGVMQQSIFDELIKCLKESRNVKRGLKKYLQ